MRPIGLPPNLSEDPMNQAILARVFAEMALAGVGLVRSSTDMMLRQRAVDAMDTVSTTLGTWTPSYVSVQVKMKSISEGLRGLTILTNPARVS
jgi:ABC-type proline/glycine betaine transport system substrate-binding protein